MRFTDSPYIMGSRAPKPSYITLPSLDDPLPRLLDFFDRHFPRVGRDIWLNRFQMGLICDEKGKRVDESTAYRRNARLSYYRELKAEPRIPFQEQIIYQDEHILLADKPHFLPVTPSGKAINECLLYRLVGRTGNHQLAPLHRLDRDTAGLVLFSKTPATRKFYSALFSEGNIVKQYEAVASLPTPCDKKEWLIESRIEASGEWILNHNVAGEINARSRLVMLESDALRARFSLFPLTGKTHQLRLHMGLIGAQILHDPFYPLLQPERALGDYAKPLQLLAKSLSFTDPLSGKIQQFESQRCLLMWSSLSECLEGC
ncbi:MAG: pseudouridine synthase [Mariprofundus sp.]|nr:pseudouridine synthase [Mariprofundus sp.]